MNFYYSSNPSNLQDALWQLLKDDISNISKYIIFLGQLELMKNLLSIKLDILVCCLNLWF